MKIIDYTIKPKFVYVLQSKDNTDNVPYFTTTQKECNKLYKVKKSWHPGFKVVIFKAKVISRKEI